MIRDQLADALRAALDTLEVDPLPDEIQLERPARREHGDWSSQRGAGHGQDRPAATPASWPGSWPSASNADAARPRRPGRGRRARAS